MIKNKNFQWFLLIFMIISISFTYGTMNASAHDPRYIDLKYYEEDQILSVYIDHGVSNSSYHYINRVTIEFYELPQSLVDSFISDPDRRIESEGDIHRFGEYKIREADVFDHVNLKSMNGTLMMDVSYTSQPEDLIIHYNYSIECPEWTLILVTAYCNLGGSFTQTLISGHPWYDPEHSMIEAVVPTLVCSVVVMTPLALWRIFGKKKEEDVKH